MPKSKKKKQKNQDFQKIKLKVGRKLTRGQNETVATFQARSIHIREQLQTDVSQPTTHRKLNIKDLFSQCQHYSISVRHEALTGLRELLATSLELIRLHLSSILERVSELLLDKDPAVRQAVIKLLKFVFPQVKSTEIAPFFPVVSAYICCAMTHIDDDIQVDSLSVLDLCLESYPTLVIGEKSQIMANFIELVSRQNSVSKSGASSAESHSRSLLVNPGSRLSSQKWRQKVLERVQRFLRALNSQRSSKSSGQTVGSIFCRHEKGVHYLPLPATGENTLCLGQGFLLRKARMDVSALSGSSGASHGGQLQSFLQALVPLLLQMWVEVGPAQLTSDLPGNALSPESMATLASVVDILQLLLDLVEQVSEDSTEIRPSWVHQHYQQDIFHHLLPAFPYCMHEKPRTGKHRPAKVEGPQVSILSLNLGVCQVMAYFDPSLSQVSEYVIQIVMGKKVSMEQLEDILKIVDRLVKHQSNQIVVENLLQALLKLYQSRGPLAAEKWMLINFFSDLSLHCQLQSVTRSSSLNSWLGTLPALLVDCASNSERVTQLLIIIRNGVTQNKVLLLAQLQEEMISLLDPSKKIIGSWKSSNQKQLFELFMWIPKVGRSLFSAIAQLCHSNDLHLESLKYLLQILFYRYQQCGTDKFLHSSTVADYFSLLLSLLLGCTKEHLEKINQVNDDQSTLSKAPFSISMDILHWKEKTSVTKAVCESCNLLPESAQIHRIFASQIIPILENYQTLPCSTVWSILNWVCFASAVFRGDQSSSKTVASLLLSWTHNLVILPENSTHGYSDDYLEEVVGASWDLFEDVILGGDGIGDCMIEMIIKDFQDKPDCIVDKSRLEALHKALKVHNEMGCCLSSQVLQLLSVTLKEIENKHHDVNVEQLWTDIKYLSSFKEYQGSSNND